LPGIACEISRQFFSLARLDPRRSGWVDGFAVGNIPQGLVEPSLTEPSVRSIEELGKIIKATLFKAGVNTNRISLAIPDACARVAIHPFEALPSKQEEKTELLKWKLKKTIPYDIDDSHLSFVEQPTETGKNYVITVNIHKAVLAQFEEVFESLGIQVGFITLATFATYELLARQHQDEIQKSVLFLRVRASNISSLIIQQEAVVFYRHTDFDFESPMDLMVNWSVDPYEEIHPCLMYTQDKLGATGVDKVYLAYPRDFSEVELSSLAERAQASVSNFDPSKIFQWKQAMPSNLLHHTLSPSLGLALGKF
jgi:type IV pilus assembly protein PilM